MDSSSTVLDYCPDTYHSWEEALNILDQMMEFGISAGLSAQAVRAGILESMGNDKRFERWCL